jgi:hypothetical protein
MATWQVEFAIVPRRALAAAPRASLDHVVTTDWWASGSLPADYGRHLAAIAPQAPEAVAQAGHEAAPNETHQTWGQPDGNRIDVWFEHGRAARITAQVDARRLDSRFGATLLQFARVANAVLVRRDGLVIEPLVGAFANALRTSEAWRYANDTESFLASQADGDDDAAR